MKNNKMINISNRLYCILQGTKENINHIQMKHSVFLSEHFIDKNSNKEK